MNNKGFTLVEVLVALAIIAIALVAVMKVMGQSVRQTGRIKEKLAAHWVAMNIMAEVQIGLIQLDNAQGLEGSENMFGGQWHWHADIIRNSDPILNKIVVTVQHEQSHEVVESLMGAM